MGLFGKKSTQTRATTETAPPKRQGWVGECGPLCGFRVQDHDKIETAKIVQLHLKNSHKTNMTEAEILPGLKPTTL